MTTTARRRALVTNDDGVGSPGLAVLATAAMAEGFGVTVAAPSWDSSGSSASLTAVQEDGRFLIERRRLPEIDIEAIAVEAAPAFIARAAIFGAFGPAPDLVLSGVNLGPNLGRNVLHSGTVGAVLAAANKNHSGIAVSIGVGPRVHWHSAEAVTRQAIRWIMAHDGVISLNLNVPNVPARELRGIKHGGLSTVGAVQATVTESGAGFVKLAYQSTDSEPEPDTDAAIFAAGFVSVTSLTPVAEVADPRLDGLVRETDEDLRRDGGVGAGVQAPRRQGGVG